MSGDVVDVQEVYRELRLGGEIVRALQGIALRIERGEGVSFMDPPGSEKTTLFNRIGGPDRPPTRGRVFVLGQEISALKSCLAARLRSREIGCIFQTCRLMRVLTAIGHAALPAAGIAQLPKSISALLCQQEPP